MVTVIYFLTFLASVFMVVRFLLRNRRTDRDYVIFGIVVSLNTLGGWLIAQSETVEQAIMANKIMYVGACYVLLVLSIILARLSNIYISKKLLLVLTGFCTLILGLVMTIGYSDIYYRSVKLIDAGGYHYLIKDYGPAHQLFTALEIIFGILLVYILVKAFVNRNKIAFRSVLVVGSVAISVVVVYLFTRFSHSLIEWYYFAYLAAIIIFGRLFERINTFDMTTNIALAVEQMSESGYIVFDNKKRYINANEFFKELFPEINDWIMEKPVEETDSLLYCQVVMWFMEHEVGDYTVISVDDRFMRISIRPVFRGKKSEQVGYLLEMIDRTAEHKYLATVESYNDQLTREVAEKTQHINDIKDMMVLGMASMVESRDNSTGDHIRRTSMVVSIFAKKISEYQEKMHLSNYFLKMVEKAAPMHDLGKITVDDAILRKKGKYTDEEYDKMKRHSVEGTRIIRDILTGVEDDSFIEVAENVAHYHHEMWNGQGYPEGLSGEAIPVEARIMALADVFDALVSKRYYKEAYDYDTAFCIIQDSVGTHFDPVLGTLFLECRPELEQLYCELAAGQS